MSVEQTYATRRAGLALSAAEAGRFADIEPQRLLDWEQGRGNVSKHQFDRLTQLYADALLDIARLAHEIVTSWQQFEVDGFTRQQLRAAWDATQPTTHGA